MSHSYSHVQKGEGGKGSNQKERREEEPTWKVQAEDERGETPPEYLISNLQVSYLGLEGDVSVKDRPDDIPFSRLFAKPSSLTIVDSNITNRART